MNSLKRIIPQSLKKRVKRALINVWETPVYRFSRHPIPSAAINRIVFVCKGNICRSAFAQYYLTSLLYSKDIVVESCGIDVNRETMPPPEAIKVAKQFGVDMSRHRSKGLDSCDLLNADMIVPVEFSQRRTLVKIYPELDNRISLLRDFAPFPENLVCNIHDPYGQKEKEFKSCFCLMEKALKRLSYRIEASFETK